MRLFFNFTINPELWTQITTLRLTIWAAEDILADVSVCWDKEARIFKSHWDLLQNVHIVLQIFTSVSPHYKTGRKEQEKRVTLRRTSNCMFFYGLQVQNHSVDISLIQRDSWNLWFLNLKWQFYIYLHLHYCIHLPMEDRFQNRIIKK